MPVFCKLRAIGSLLLCVLWVSACDPELEGTSAYSLSQGCFALQSPVSREWVILQGNDQYQIQVENSTQAPAAFYLKASGLGRYLLYDQKGGFLAVDQSQLKRQMQADEKAEWDIRFLASFQNDGKVIDNYTAVNQASKKRFFIQNGESKLQEVKSGPLNPEEVALSFVALPRSQCLDFPEAELNAEVSPAFQQTQDKTQPVYGFVDFHTHVAFPKALGAAAMSGDVFHPYGIAQALRSCSDLHGENGELDLLEGQTATKSDSGHATAGYPDFTYWPNRSTNTHVMAYYRWIQRAYLSGLRLMVTNATGNPTFCQLLGVMHPKDSKGDCRSDADLAMQTRYIYEMQDYIDAQEGGPEKGWFRIVTSSKEARAVIQDNKLAVVLGSEYGTLFDCTEGAGFCTEDYIDKKIEELHKQGIRSVFPIHRFDNAFGGTMPQGGTNGSWMHLTSKISTSAIQHLTDLLNPAKLLFKPIGGHYWELEKCPDGVGGSSHIKSMQKFIDDDFSFLSKIVSKVPVVGDFAAKLLGWVFIDKLKPLPPYAEFQEDGHACNNRPLQKIGRYLIEKLAERGMILEIDHMSYVTLQQTLDTLDELQYPGFVSSHGWIENLPEIRQRMFRLGGLMSASNGSPASVGRSITQYSEEMASFFPGRTGIGIGTDIQGISTQAMGENDLKIQYPFDSVDGTVRFTQPKTGHRVFDFNREGVAHYGLLAEWIEELRQVDQRDGTNAVKSLMASAESYLQMWENAENHAGLR